MTHLALLLAAFAYDPHPDDCQRFGLPFTPAVRGWDHVSPAKYSWWMAIRRRDGIAAERAARWWLDGIDDELADARWRASVWCNAEDLANSDCPADRRLLAAKELRRLIGPVAYLKGELPAPWPGGKD